MRREPFLAGAGWRIIRVHFPVLFFAGERPDRVGRCDLAGPVEPETLNDRTVRNLVPSAKSGLKRLVEDRVSSIGGFAQILTGAGCGEQEASTAPLFGDGILRSLLQRVSLAKQISASVPF